MKGLLWVLTLAALAVGIAVAAHYNDGYVLLIIPPYRTEISLNLAMLFLFAGFVVFYAVLRGLALTLSLPQRVREFRERRLRDKTAAEITEITRLIYEGRFGLALKKAAAVHATGQSMALAAMLAARSAQRLHEPLKQKEWLDKAVQDDPKMQSACWMMEAEMLVEMQRFDEALVVLQRLHEASSGRHIAALQLELRARQGAGHEDEVLRIAHLLEKHDALSPEQMRALKVEKLSTPSGG
jgi:HemY protein